MTNAYRYLQTPATPVSIAEPTPAKDMVDEFSKWLSQQSIENQVELAEFVGFFCYKQLFSTLMSNDAKIAAIHEYLNSFRNDRHRSIKVLKFIDQIIHFIMEINRDAESAYFSWHGLNRELPGVTSLYNILIDLPQRSKRWAFSFLQWQRFKTSFYFFEDELGSNEAVREKSKRSNLEPDPSIVLRNKRVTKTTSSALF